MAFLKQMIFLKRQRIKKKNFKKGRVWSSKQIEFQMDSTNSFLNQTKNRTNNYWLGKFSIQDYHLIIKHQILGLNKLDRKILHNIQVLTNFLRPTLEPFFENVFVGHASEWNKIYILPRVVSADSTIWIFQYTFFHNVL